MPVRDHTEYSPALPRILARFFGVVAVLGWSGLFLLFAGVPRLIFGDSFAMASVWWITALVYMWLAGAFALALLILWFFPVSPRRSDVVWLATLASYVVLAPPATFLMFTHLM